MFLLIFKSVPFFQPLLTCPMLCIDSPWESWAFCIPLLKAAIPQGQQPRQVLPTSHPSLTLSRGS